MTALALSRMSKIAPDPWHADHGGGIRVGYTCHMAGMHWAQMVLGATQAQANEIVTVFNKLYCPGCKGTGPHGSVSPTDYGMHFCRTAQRVPNKAALAGMVNVGDILITGQHQWPMHTLVVRQVRGPDHVTVRGFNNFGTLGTGQRDRYDPVSHNITQDKFWSNAATGLFGHGAAPLFVVPHADYMGASQRLRIEFQRTARLRA